MNGEAGEPSADAEEGAASGGAPKSNPRRPRKLSRERILAAALSLVDREGLDALSMRRVASELGVEAMALYRYASSKDDLLDGLVESLYLELNESLASGAAGLSAGGWRAELHVISREKYRIATVHPHIVPLVATRLLRVPLARRPMAYLIDQERSLALFARAGLDDERALLAYRVCDSWVLGYILLELRAVVDNPDEPEPAFRLGIHRMPAQELPRLRAGTPGLAQRVGTDVLSAGLDALLDRLVGTGD